MAEKEIHPSMRFRILVALFAFSLVAPLFAQTTEIGFFGNRATFTSDTATDAASGLTSATVKFDKKVGYGISFTQFLSPSTSIQVSGQTVRGDAKVTVAAGGVTAAEAGGSLDLKQFDAALHWYLNPRSSYKFYVGAGAAWMRQGKLTVAADATDSIPAGTIAIANKTTWLADAGIDLAISQAATITLSAKYTHYTATLAPTPDDPNKLFQQLRLNPMILSAGLRFKF
jgi:outer membrane protein W